MAKPVDAADAALAARKLDLPRSDGPMRLEAAGQLSTRAAPGLSASSTRCTAGRASMRCR